MKDFFQEKITNLLFFFPRNLCEIYSWKKLIKPDIIFKKKKKNEKRNI